ncbi:MAG: diguanylate cyclase [bacterium]|nr:diguanylate cyclase [bacterium]
MNTKIQTKLTILLCFIILVFFVVLFIVNTYEKQRAALLLQEQIASKELFFDKIVKLKETTLANFAYDYTYWDEMVEFVASGNKQWAKQNIDASLATFKTDVVWVYNSQWQLVYTARGEGMQREQEFPLPRAIYPQLFKRSPLVHFYLDTPAGLLELHGASIHPSSDQERKTSAKGYFLAGRLWTAEYLQELAELTGSKLSLISFKPESHSQNQENLASGTIGFTRTLHGWDNRPVKQIVVKSESPIIQSLQRTANQELLLLFGFTIILLLVLTIFITRWVSIPLRLISRSLGSRNPELLISLHQNPTEFRHISKLIASSFAQERELVREINERKQTEQQLRETKQQMIDIINFLPDATFAINREGIVIAWNKAIEEMTGIKAEIMIGKGTYEYALPFYGERRPILIDLIFVDQSEIESRYHNVTKKGNTIVADTYVPNLYQGKGATLWIIASPLYDTQGNIIGAIESIRDITERKRAEAEVYAAQQRYADLVNNLAVGVYRNTPGAEGRFLEVNPAMVAMFEAESKEEFMRRSVASQYVEPSQRKVLSDKLMQQGYVKNEEIELLTFKGRRFWASVTAVKKVDEQGQVYFDGVIEDITERKELEQLLRALSLTDELTGLYNRRGFLTLAEQQLKIADRLKQQLCLIYGDMDNLKWINDNFGHQEGDRAIIDIAEVLRASFRAADIIARIGGDEFVGLAIETTEKSGESITARIMENINAINIQGRRKYKLSLSLGVTQYDPDNPCSIEELLKQGDTLMYEQKKMKKTKK